jgi:hypothetical protein
MAKVVKLKLKDIENIVKNINENESEMDQNEQGQTGTDLPIAVGKGEDGKFYVFDTNSGEILGSPN